MSQQPFVHFIEDDADSRQATQALLEVFGWQVRPYSTAEEFLSLISDSDAGCVLADYRLPGLSGLQLFQTLRQRNIALPVLLISGHAELPVVEAALSAGVAEFLLKPVQPNLLQKALSRYLPAEHGQT